MSQVWDKHSKKVCPRCHQEYTGYPALSRVDNHTYICSDGGRLEAWQGIARSPWPETEPDMDSEYSPD